MIFFNVILVIVRNQTYVDNNPIRHIIYTKVQKNRYKQMEKATLSQRKKPYVPKL
jgi:hypothetical protein